MSAGGKRWGLRGGRGWACVRSHLAIRLGVVVVAVSAKDMHADRPALALVVEQVHQRHQRLAVPLVNEECARAVLRRCDSVCLGHCRNGYRGTTGYLR
jgi:hypothetical protein